MVSSHSSQKEQLFSVLNRKKPQRYVFAPNYWQWFAHHRNHGLLPEEISHCKSQLDLIKYLGLEVFSRNVYCDEQRCWFGGLSETRWNGIEAGTVERWSNGDRIIDKTYRTKHGGLTERFRYDFGHSTLVQEKFMIDDYANQMDMLEDVILARTWRFDTGKYSLIQSEVGGCGTTIAGELYSPLKMLHLVMGPVNTTYFLLDYPERAAELMKLHEISQLDLVRQMAEAGVGVMMSMDNLDTMFHPPEYVKKYSASFYQKASSICHEYNALLFIHACGRQKDNLPLIASLGVDGLEGVAFPPLGDVELDEAVKISGDKFIITGGISAMEIRNLTGRDQVSKYIKGLFEKMKPYANRFILSASCNTPVDTSWESIKWFRDAWEVHGVY